MNTPKFKIIYDKKNLAESTGKPRPVEIYVYDTATKKKTYVLTGVEVMPDQFATPSGGMGQVVKHPNKTALNGAIEKVYRGVQAFAFSDECKTLDDIKYWDKTPEHRASADSFIEFMEDELEKRNLAQTSWTQHNTLIKRLKEFGKIKTFQDINYGNVVDFYRFLQEEGENREPLSNSTLKKRHSTFQSYVIEAVNRGFVLRNPCGLVKIKKGNPKDPVYLTEEELRILTEYPLEKKVEGERLLKVRDVFVFQCYTGLAYVDLRAFTKEQIFEIDGEKVIRSNRQKTDQSFISVLLPEAIRILEKYNYNLPVISMQKYNDYLKLVALYIVDKQGDPIIKKNLTSHVARHSFLPIHL